ncbi:MAG: hypothetical protein ACLR23_23530 [Clostridia bacterium]
MLGHALLDIDVEAAQRPRAMVLSMACRVVCWERSCWRSRSAGVWPPGHGGGCIVDLFALLPELTVVVGVGATSLVDDMASRQGGEWEGDGLEIVGDIEVGLPEGEGS